MKNLNLCEILKGHKEEIFYSPTFGNMKLNAIYGKFIKFMSILLLILMVHFALREKYVYFHLKTNVIGINGLKNKNLKFLRFGVK